MADSNTSTIGDPKQKQGIMKKQTDNITTSQNKSKIKSLLFKNVTAKNFFCTFADCSLAFDRTWKLEAHVHAVHKKIKPYVCSVEGCQKSYISQSHLQRHHKISHTNVSPLLCTYSGCLSTFTTTSALKNHCKKFHESSNGFVCTLCNESFTNGKVLKYHMKKHVKTSFDCSICKKSWLCESYLQRHMKSHQLKKCPHDNCPMALSSQHELRKHIVDAHPVVHICDHCGEKILLKSALREHVMQHFPMEDRLSFVCPHDLCGRSYLHKRNLKQHIALFHCKKRYYCDQLPCRSSYTDPLALAKHQHRKHKIPLPSVVGVVKNRKNNFIKRLTDSAVQDTEELLSKPVQAKSDYSSFNFFVINSDHTLTSLNRS